MAETTEQSRLNWIAALDRIEGLKPHAVVAGHKNPANDDNPQHIEATRKYIRDFNRLNHQTTTVNELYDKNFMTRCWHYTRIAPTLVHFGVRHGRSNNNLGIANA
jgi:hypothetical protein